jgi:tetratricopeptide (TPR) repeat protein
MNSDLSPARWREVEELFAKAWDVPAADRDRFVREHARGDRALATEVLALIGAAVTSPDYLDGVAASLRLAGVDVGAAPDRTGRRVGPYRLTRVLGHGGMGSVYLAERADGAFSQTVAIKLLRVGMMGPARERRFLAERQILARMEDPHIARLLDGGVTDDGTPYFVMEYVDGLPIDKYCERHALSMPQRLRIFLSVCAAVDSAHRNLVIHRDLKPTNVLVTESGTVKLLDFGIAKILSQDDGATDGQPLTPAYASPEQLAGQPLTTAVDVWGLGAILYELVAARRAFNRGRDDSGTPPPPPSQLRRGVSRDVDTIVLTALQTAPERRYPSVVQLADDVRRHLAGLPIQARADSRMYRLTCFVQRHRYGVAAAALIFTLLGALTGLSFHSAARAREQAARIAQEHEASTEVMRFLVDVFATADPAVHRGQAITARELLDRGAARVRTELAGRPEIQATLLGTIGRVYRQLGLLDRATPLLDEALAQRQRIFTPPHPAIAEALQELGLARWGAGQSADAERLLRESLDMRQALSGRPDEPSVEARTALGRLLSGTGRPDAGVQELRLAVQQAREVGGDETPMLARGQYHLATVLHHQGKLEEAAGFFRQAAALYRRLPMEPTTESAESVLTLASLEGADGKDALAASLYAEALDVHRRLYGVNHPKYAEVLRHSANMAPSAAQELARAEAQLNEAVRIYAHLAVPDHEGLAAALVDVGRLRKRRGNRDAAVSAFHQALMLSRRSANPTTAAQALYEIALIDRDRGRLTQAEHGLREAAAIYRQALGPESPMLLRVAMAQGEVAHERGRHAVAQTLFRHALQGFEARLGPNHVRSTRARLALGICLARTGRIADARPLLVAAEARLRSTVGADAPETRRAAAALAGRF